MVESKTAKLNRLKSSRAKLIKEKDELDIDVDMIQRFGTAFGRPSGMSSSRRMNVRKQRGNIVRKISSYNQKIQALEKEMLSNGA
jgi:hypothetical protein